MGEVAITKLVVKSFNMIGIKRECLFKEFSTALPSARAELHNQYDLDGASTELIFYVMTDEKYIVELYDKRFNANSADSEMEIYIPVKASK